MRLQNKVAVITGAGRGIGRAIAHLFAKNGASVMVLDKDKNYAEETAQAMMRDGLNVQALACDVTDSITCRKALKQTQSIFGKLDILVNNAGITRDAMLHKMLEEAWDSDRTPYM